MLMAVKVVKATKSVAAAAALIYVFSPNTRPPRGVRRPRRPPISSFLVFSSVFLHPTSFLKTNLTWDNLTEKTSSPCFFYALL